MSDPMNQFPECDQFNAHRRRICRGERTDLTRAMINRYRTAWGVGPLPANCGPTSPMSGSSLPVSFSASGSSLPSSLAVLPSERGGVSPPALSLLQRVTTFAAALKAHIRDGLAKCDHDEIQVRLELCQQCPSFTGTHCRECGCSCGGSQTFLNKLAWRSEACPLGRW